MQSIFIANGNPLRSVSKHIQSGAIVQMVNGRLEGLIPGDLGSNESVFLCFTKNDGYEFIPVDASAFDLGIPATGKYIAGASEGNLAFTPLTDSNSVVLGDFTMGKVTLNNLNVTSNSGISSLLASTDNELSKVNITSPFSIDSNNNLTLGNLSISDFAVNNTESLNSLQEFTESGVNQMSITNNTVVIGSGNNLLMSQITSDLLKTTSNSSGNLLTVSGNEFNVFSTSKTIDSNEYNFLGLYQNTLDYYSITPETIGISQNGIINYDGTNFTGVTGTAGQVLNVTDNGYEFSKLSAENLNIISNSPGIIFSNQDNTFSTIENPESERVNMRISGLRGV